MAIALNIFEGQLPPLPFNIRIGLANIIALITIEILGVKEMIIVNTMRVVIGTLMRGLFLSSTFFISLSGVALSSLVLVICHKLKCSLLFTSVCSAIAHSLGQVLFVCFLYKQPAMLAILPYLLAGSVGMGVITGIVAREAIKRVQKNMHL